MRILRGWDTWCCKTSIVASTYPADKKDFRFFPQILNNIELSYQSDIKRIVKIEIKITLSTLICSLSDDCLCMRYILLTTGGVGNPPEKFLMPEI